jgi:hypothetical protein
MSLNQTNITLKNCNDLCMLEGYGHTMSTIRNKHPNNLKGPLMLGYNGLNPQFVSQRTNNVKDV